MKTNYYINSRVAPMKLWGLLCLGFMVFFSSCDKDSEDSLTAFTLQGNPTELTASPSGTSETYNVQTSGSWKVEPLRDERWLRIEPAEGTGDGSFTVTVDRNRTPDARSSILTFTVDGRVHTSILTIEQEAGSQDTGEGEIYVNLDGMESLEVPEEGLNARFAVRSTGEWRAEIIEGDDWFSMSVTEGQYDTGVDISVSPNLEVDPRTAKVIFYLDGERVPGEFEVVQEGVILILFEDFNWLNYGSPIFYTTGGETRIDLWSAAEKERGWTYYKRGADNIPSTYARVGFVKLGKTNYGADILSPKLTEVEGTQNLRVSFKAVPYQTAGGARDVTRLTVGVEGPGTVSQENFNINNWPNYDTDPTCTIIWTLPETTRTFTITGATAETQVWFLGGAYDLRESSDWDGERNVNRIFLDDILITVLK